VEERQTWYCIQMMMHMTLVIWVLVQLAKAIPMKNLNMMYIRK